MRSAGIVSAAILSLLISTAAFAAPPATRPLTAPIEKKDPDARKHAEAAKAILDRNSAAHPPEFMLETGRSRKMEASLAFVAAAPRMAATEYVIFGPLPPTLSWQSHIKAEGTPPATEIKESAGLHRPMLQWRMKIEDPKKKMVQLGVQYTLELAPRSLIARAATSGAGGAGATAAETLTAEEKAAFTAPGTLADYESAAFQAWLAASSLRPAAKESDLDFARRAFVFVKQKSTFEFNESIERRASIVHKSMKSDCGGLTALYVAILRANGIPARQMIGRWARTAKPEEKLEGQEWQQEHIKVEFFAGGIGWVPVDLSVAVVYDKKPESLEQFGQDAGDFVALHIDPDLKVDTIHFGLKTLPLLQEPVYWVTGAGSMNDSISKSDWQVIPLRGDRPGK